MASKLDAIRALREQAYEKSLAKSRPETAKTTKTVVDIAPKPTATAVQQFEHQPATTNSVVSMPSGFKELMKAAKLTHRKFAELTGTPLRTIEDWSRGASPAPPIARAWLRLYIETRHEDQR